MLLYLKTILFGIVEGITEWLPISSTGHMILLNEFVKLDVSKDFYSMFQVVIQLGAILAVVVIYWNQIWPFKKNTNPMVKGFFKYVDRDIFDLWLKIIFACIPAAVVGLLFDDNACGIYQVSNNTVSTPVNAAGLYYNVYHHARDIYWNDLSANAVVFTLA